MRSYLFSGIALAALVAGPTVCFAADTDAGSEPTEGAGGIVALPNAAMVSDGQIALTARNNGDGTWAVTAGPGGEIRHHGLAKEEAIAIVGAPTGPYTPDTHQDAVAADKRVDAEQRLVNAAATGALEPDENGGRPEGLHNRSVRMPSAAEAKAASKSKPPRAGPGARSSATGAPKNGG
jgi:hypothetical protein